MPGISEEIDFGDEYDEQKYHLSDDPTDLKEITIQDENGEVRKAFVCRIVADRDLTTTGVDGSTVTVANAGDKGGYVEVELDTTGKPMLPVQPGEDGAASMRYEGRLKGLSQNGNSWVHEGCVLAGEASVRDDAQIQGVETMITGADAYTGQVGVGGRNYRSCGMSEFSGHGSYTDMYMAPGARYEFSGGTQIGDRVNFEAGQGKFGDGPNGETTMLFGDEQSDGLFVETREGFEANGMVALGRTSLKGSLKGSPGMIVQDSQLDTDAVFDGDVVLVSQDVGPEADGQVFKSDADLDGLYDFDAPMTGVDGLSDDDYRAKIDEIIAHELGEQYADTNLQSRTEKTDTVQLYGAMMDDFGKSPDEMDRQEFDAARIASSAFHDGINDARAQTQTAFKWAEGTYEGFQQTAAGKEDERTHQARLAAQGKAMKEQTSGRTDWILTKEDSSKPNPNKRVLPSYQGPADGSDGTGKDGPDPC